jgi:FkbM family methyltransferase
MRDVARAPLNPAHYRALAGMLRVYPRPLVNLRRYLTRWGEYPYRCLVRTPTGTVAPTLYSRHDMLTINEIFCREDYRPPSNPHVVVDIGSNIGLSALYFLTRSRSTRAYLFEPDPRNIDRLRENLRGYEDRYFLEPVAVSTQSGEATFGIEASGRYGLLSTRPGVGHPHFPPSELIVVQTKELNTILEDVLASERSIDVLKIDTEGIECELVASIRPQLLERIDTIFYETPSPAPLHTDRYEFRFESMTNRLTRAV